MKQDTTITRRSALRAVATGVAGSWISSKSALAEESGARRRNGHLKQSVCKWCYKDMALEDLARNAAQIGLKSVELLTPEEWPVVKKYGLTCAMGSGADQIPVGFNRKENHDSRVANLTRHIDLAADAGIPNVICFSGNRNGMSDEEGLENCVIGLKRIVGHAEKKGVNVCMELLNSKVNHKDYMCDHTEWGVKLVKKVSSSRFKLLYDIYHMQIMEGDLARGMQENLARIAHLQLADNPGRNEPGTGEINYPFLFDWIDRIGYQGWIGCEYKPKAETVAGLGWLKPYM
jgi:hydroxypyruvate isomerase